MAVVVMNQGLREWALTIFGQVPPDAWTCRLWVQYRVPGPSDVLANYVACSWPGYSDFALTNSQWTPANTPTGSPWSYPLITFNFDPSSQAQQTVFGYLIYGTGGLLLYAEAFSAPFPIAPEGGSIPLQLFWSDKQC